MLIADSYLGHRNDPVVGNRLADADTHHVVLSDIDRRRSRIRTETTDGHDLGVVVARDLADGDVLETEGGAVVVVELAAVEALVVSLDNGVAAVAALELGHAVGNRHWELAVQDGKAFIPVTGTRDQIEATVDEHLPDVHRQYESVLPTIFDDGVSAPVAHSHAGEEDGHTHDHSDDSHTHDHHVPTTDGTDR